jgi:hypothetical protein
MTTRSRGLRSAQRLPRQQAVPAPPPQRMMAMRSAVPPRSPLGSPAFGGICSSKGKTPPACPAVQARRAELLRMFGGVSMSNPALPALIVPHPTPLPALLLSAPTPTLAVQVLRPLLRCSSSGLQHSAMRLNAMRHALLLRQSPLLPQPGCLVIGRHPLTPTRTLYHNGPARETHGLPSGAGPRQPTGR